MATATNGVHVAANGAQTANALLEIKTTEPSSPADRWETVFIWGFILKFQSLKGTVEGLETITDLEQAIMHDGYSPVLHAILAHFIENLSPKAATNISGTLYALIQEFCSTNERSVWWSTVHNKNINPFKSDMDFYTMAWGAKILILRQLVEWQLSHNSTTRNWLDRAHGVVRGGHRKRSDDQPRPTLVPPDPEHTREKLEFKPLGQDAARRRYWTVDDSPRIYISGNPWKASCPFHAISTTREEYAAIIQALKDTSPPVRQGKRRSKLEAGHDELVRKLEEQLPQIDAELQKALEEQAKQRAREVQEAQSGARESRTRTKATKPEYVYRPEEEYQLDDDDEEPAPKVNGKKKAKPKPEPKPRPSAASDAPRRSGRATQKRSYAEDEPPVRGERRSSRRQTIASSRAEYDEDSDARPTKRSRMSSVGSSNAETSTSGPAQASAAIAAMSLNGAASTTAAQTTKGNRSGEKVIETVAGKKKSKFWYYVVETPDSPSEGPDSDAPAATENGAEGPKMEVETKQEDAASTTNDIPNGTHDLPTKSENGTVPNGVASTS
ncbi:hypothetical protein M407DRAFT_67364 [Tulasnella calospora MUT 4182]|uniref:WHIM1 domain-containing protein n=1 Tax=Tulasnella calospora MUT 4182 TaxID=1051891 RepID=A0A0C3QSF7_9AGAM|nr:hypothetical protein M407DRAFT_67364 [Tulasnella calospora MUT 4182]